MSSVVLTHVNQLGGALYATECGFEYVNGFAYKSYYGAVCCLSRVNIKSFDALNTFYGISNIFNDTFIAPFTKVRYAFNQFLFHGYQVMFSMRNLRKIAALLTKYAFKYVLNVS